MYGCVYMYVSIYKKMNKTLGWLGFFCLMVRISTVNLQASAGHLGIYPSQIKED